jgi:hypothetical protein
MSGQCVECLHWELATSGMQQHGYALCGAREEQLRPGHYTADSNVCRLAKFQQAPDEVVCERLELIG